VGQATRCAVHTSSQPQRRTRAGRRAVGLSAASGRVDITILDLDVSATLLEYDDESYMQAILRELALVADAYLRGEGLVQQKRGILRTRPALKIIVNGNEWILGRRTSSIHYPKGCLCRRQPELSQQPPARSLAWRTCP
jgi:hypothetical protein